MTTFLTGGAIPRRTLLRGLGASLALFAVMGASATGFTLSWARRWAQAIAVAGAMVEQSTTTLPAAS